MGTPSGSIIFLFHAVQFFVFEKTGQNNKVMSKALMIIVCACPSLGYHDLFTTGSDPPTTVHGMTFRKAKSNKLNY